MELAIEQDEKFACLAFSRLNIILDEVPDPFELGLGCWCSGRLPFQLDSWWRRQLGDVVCEHLEQQCSFVLLAKQQTTSDDPFGDETEILKNRVMFLMWGLGVTAGVGTFDFARLIFGRGSQAWSAETGYRSLRPLPRDVWHEAAVC